MSHNHNQRNHHQRVVSLTLVLALAFSTLLSAQMEIATAQTAGPTWAYTGNLNSPRVGHTATLLPGGKLLVVGGDDGEAAGPLNTAVLYDPSTGMWSLTGNLNTARAGHTATLLPNGKVLVAGGWAGGDDTSSAELYDPATGTWTLTGNLNVARDHHTATLLADGKILVVGGDTDNDFDPTTAKAELYDPNAGKWSLTGSLHKGRGDHTATPLPNGRVLVAGGTHYNFNPGANSTESLQSSELYDPNTGTWSVTGDLNVARDRHTATTLRNGNVLVVGGGQWHCSGIAGINFSCSSSAVNSAELYNPGTGTWSTTASLSTPRFFHTATLLPDGQVLVVGGDQNSCCSPALDSAELYDPTAETRTAAASLNTARTNQTATLLSNGRVLIAGGTNHRSVLSSAELYSSDFSFIGNPVDDSQFFVQQHYLDFLSREPDSSGLAFWTNEIASCGTDQQCVEVKRINVSAAYFLSIEFQQTGYLVYRMYKAAYGNLPNAPVPLTFNTFLYGTKKIAHGVIVGQMDWETVLENNKQAFSNELVKDSGFTSLYPPNMTPAQFVDRLNANAGNTVSQSDRDQLVKDLEIGAISRAQVLRSVAENQNFSKAEFNRAFVLMQYFGYLRCNPNDAPDTNFDGYNFWLDKLNSFNGNFLEAEMVKAFINSSEYRKRFGPRAM